jgi:hypothetical protein
MKKILLFMLLFNAYLHSFAQNGNFTISTAEELKNFASMVNSGNDFKGKTVKLGTNIMLNDTVNNKKWKKEPPANKWTAIGINRDSAFKGTFDGNGFVIGGVYINDYNSDFPQGLFGYIDSDAIVKNLGVVASYIRGNWFVGGIAGHSNGSIMNSSFAGTVEGRTNVGGLVGKIDNYSAVINNSYSTGAVKGIEEVGGLAGNAFKRTISDSYSSSIVMGMGYDGRYIGELAGYSGDKGIDMRNNYFAGTVTRVTGKELAGDKPEYIITTAKELIDFAKLVNEGNDFRYRTVKLKSNIILNDTANWQNWVNNPPANNWTPIGNVRFRPTETANAFQGTFDGNGFTIAGVYVSNSKDNQGLFGVIGGQGIVKNLKVVASYIRGETAVGGIAANSYGYIYDCYFAGIVEGKYDVGGLVGKVTGYRSGHKYWEGTDASINNSYSTGAVTGIDKIGGLAGFIYYSTIRGSYSTSTVKGTGSKVNALVGEEQKPIAVVQDREKIGKKFVKLYGILKINK